MAGDFSVTDTRIEVKKNSCKKFQFENNFFSLSLSLTLRLSALLNVSLKSQDLWILRESFWMMLQLKNYRWMLTGLKSKHWWTHANCEWVLIRAKLHTKSINVTSNIKQCKLLLSLENFFILTKYKKKVCYKRKINCLSINIIIVQFSS